MGCDIHAYAEKKVEGKWKLVRDEFPEEIGDHTVYRDRIDINRDYTLFALLADVRSIGFNPFSPPRGIPKDASLGYAALVDEEGPDGHSHSYFTLPELKAHREKIDAELDRQMKLYGGGVNPLDRLIENLEQVRSYVESDDDVRLVFFFDN